MSDNTVTKPAPDLTEEDHRAREIGATYGQEAEEPEIADNGPVPTYNQEEPHQHTMSGKKVRNCQSIMRWRNG